MNRPNATSFNCCPKCGAEVDQKWLVCPGCGLQLRPDDGQAQPGVGLPSPAILWGVGAVIFMALDQIVAAYNLGAAFVLAGLFGLAMTFFVGKDILVRSLRSPLTWQQFRSAPLRAGLTIFGTVIVLPFVVVVALVILAMMMCSRLPSG